MCVLHALVYEIDTNIMSDCAYLCKYVREKNELENQQMHRCINIYSTIVLAAAQVSSMIIPRSYHLWDLVTYTGRRTWLYRLSLSP